MCRTNKMYVKIISFTILLIFVRGQFPPNGDPGALKKMDAILTFQKRTTERKLERDAGLAERAIHRMKATEKAEIIQQFIERGSLFLPGEDVEEISEEPENAVPLKFNENIGEQVIDPR